MELTSVYGFHGGSDGQKFAWNAGDPGLVPGSGKSFLEKEIIHCSILNWKIPWTEESDGL